MQEHPNIGAGQRASAPAKISRRFLMIGFAVATFPASAVISEEANPRTSMISEYNQLIDRVEFLEGTQGKPCCWADAVRYPAARAHERNDRWIARLLFSSELEARALGGIREYDEQYEIAFGYGVVISLAVFLHIGKEIASGLALESREKKVG